MVSKGLAMNSIKWAIFVVSFWQIVFSEKVQYDNYRLYSVHIENDEQLNVLRELQVNPHEIIFQTTPAGVGQMIDLIVAPHTISDISQLFERYEIKNRVISENLQKLIDAEQLSNLNSSPDFGWTQYHNLSTIYSWLDQMQTKYPNVLTNYNYGKSYEGRPLRAIKVSHQKDKPTIFVESTIHAGEWITVASATYFLNELITSDRFEIRYLADHFDWVFVPLANPDGYEYTHTTNRVWRKNRRPNSNRAQCVGVDLNRNFDSHHGEVGSSPDACSEYYAGPAAFSEKETLALSEFLKTLNIKFYIDFHSYGQQLAFPVGYSSKHVQNFDDLMKIGLKGKTAISKRSGTKYAVGPISEVIYYASGSSLDWVFDTLKVPLAYVFEMRGPLFLPTDQIIPNALEVIDGIIAMIKEAQVLEYL